MTYYQECMDENDRFMVYFTLITLFGFWCPKKTKHQDTTRIVDVVVEGEKVYFPVHTPTKPGTCYQVVTLAASVV